MSGIAKLTSKDHDSTRFFWCGSITKMITVAFYYLMRAQMSPAQGSERFLFGWVNCKLESHEESIGHYQLYSSQAAVLVNAILEALQRLNVSVTAI